MKKTGNCCDHIGRRDDELHAAFMKLLASAAVPGVSGLYALAVKQPCSRFWVSEERALAVIRAIRRDASAACLRSMVPSRLRMYLVILSRVERLLLAEPRLSLPEAVGRVISSPAPEFYIEPASARVLLSRRRRRRREAAAAVSGALGRGRASGRV